MADLLIMKKEHWMSSLKQDEIDKEAEKNKYFIEKYDSRTMSGDIVEVGDDNHWSNTQHGDGAFYIVRVPGLLKKSYEYLQRPRKRAMTQQEKDEFVNNQISETYKWVIAKGIEDFNEAKFRAESEETADKLGYVLDKRRYKLDLTKLPQLQNNPVITISEEIFLNALVDKNN